MRRAMVHESVIAERRSMGHDRFDEVWDGVLHMVPFPTPRHQRVVLDLVAALTEIARRRGLEAFGDIGLYPEGSPGHRDYRGPDCAVVDPRHVSERGIEGHAHLVVEVLSPGDEARKKLAFYARVGVREVWLVDQVALRVDVISCRDGGTIDVPAHDGSITAPALGLVLAIDGTRLVIRDGAASHVIELSGGARSPTSCT